MASGLDGQRFAFHGYAPVDAGERAKQLRAWEQHSARHDQTQLLIETPYRNAAMYATLLASLKGDTRLCVARSLTTSDEWVATHTIAEWRNCPPLCSTSCPPCSCSWPADHAATFPHPGRRGGPGGLRHARPRRPGPDTSVNAVSQSSRVRAIVIHYTTEDDARSMQLLSKGKVSAHYLLSPEGRAHRLVDETRAAWHAGNSSWYGITAMNSTSIGIELVNPGGPRARTAAASGTPMTTARSAP